MANKRIEDLIEAYSVLPDDLLIISQNGRASKLRWAIIKQYIDENGGGGGGGDAIAFFSNSVAKTYTDVLEAYEANKLCVYVERVGNYGYIYPLARIDKGTKNAFFERVDTTTRTLIQINVNPYFSTQAANKTEASLMMSGTNYLRNWYFANPVNSRAQSTYLGAVYTVDGWKSSADQNSVELTNYGVKMTKRSGHTGTQAQYIYQDVDDSDNLVGRYITVSVFGRGTFRVGLTYGGTDLGNSGYKTFSNFDVASFTTWINEKVDGAKVRVVIQCENGGNFEVNKAKLEAGEVSTISVDTPQIYTEEQYKCFVSTADPTDDHAHKDIFSENVVPTDEIHANTAARHTHSNKTVLDGINVERVESWDAKADFSDIPTELPNPNLLTFTGAVNATYDGSTPVSVNIPSGGGGGGAVDSVNGKTGAVVLANLKITLGGTEYTFNGTDPVNITISSASGVSF